MLNEVHYDKSVDLYLLGLLAYEMVEGKHCFPMEISPQEQQRKIKLQEYDLPTQGSPAFKDMI